jgi:hypothetical protein
VNPAHCIEIVRSKAKLPGFSDVSWRQGKTEGDGKGEPEKSRQEKIVVITINWCVEPARRNKGVYRLSCKLVIKKCGE